MSKIKKIDELVFSFEVLNPVLVNMKNLFGVKKYEDGTRIFVLNDEKTKMQCFTVDVNIDEAIEDLKKIASDEGRELTITEDGKVILN